MAPLDTSARSAGEQAPRVLCDACNVLPEYRGVHRCCGDSPGDPVHIPCECQSPLCRLYRHEATLAELEAEDQVQQ